MVTSPGQTLTHLATTRPELAPEIHGAVRLAEDITRFEPATLAVGGLVLLALHTEIKVERNTAGEWQFRLHKKTLRDSTLGRRLGQLLALYTNVTTGACVSPRPGTSRLGAQCRR